MNIDIAQAGKKFGSEWVFRGLSLSIPEGCRLAVLGANASGKSTLMKTLAGLISLTEGSIEHSSEKNIIPPSQLYKMISVAAPYLDLVDELTVLEMTKFYLDLKNPGLAFSPALFPASSMLGDTLQKKVYELSSGKKQRLKLLLASLSNSPLVLLDEPTTNLDHQGLDFYQEVIAGFSARQTLIICSNHQASEYSFCSEQVSMEAYKQ
jgi:ABC-type multidrug transport system ATPase subunit